MATMKNTFQRIHPSKANQCLHWMLFSTLIAVTSILVQVVTGDVFFERKPSLNWSIVILIISFAGSTLLWSWLFAFQQSFKYVRINDKTPKKVFTESEIALFYFSWPSLIVWFFTPIIFIVIKYALMGIK